MKITADIYQKIFCLAIVFEKYRDLERLLFSEVILQRLPLCAKFIRVRST